MTLRYLVTGDAQTTIAASYRRSKTSVHRIIKETIKVIFDELLQAGFLKFQALNSSFEIVDISGNNGRKFRNS